MTGLPATTDYWVRTSRADRLADDMHGLALTYQADGKSRLVLSNAQRLALLRSCSILAIALCGPEWNDSGHVQSKSCAVLMCELCERDDCLCDCHFPASEPDTDSDDQPSWLRERNTSGRWVKAEEAA